jgi:hypothetical protein
MAPSMVVSCGPASVFRKVRVLGVTRTVTDAVSRCPAI